MKDSVKERLWGFVTFIALLPIYTIFRMHNNAGEGLIIVCITGVFISVIYANRRIIYNKKYLFFISILYISHIAAILAMNIPNQFLGIYAVLISFVDLWLLIFLSNIFIRKKL